jgi:hypothetical protein
MAKQLLLLALISLLGCPLRAASTPTAGACEASDAACNSMPAMSTAPAMNWQAEMDQVQKSGEACQADVEKFCDGVQVGEGRIEKCLKRHQKKLSKACRAAQGWH